MLRKIFGFIGYDDFIARPFDMIYAVAMIAAGYASILNYEWMLLGVVLFILGILFAIVIMLGILYRGPIAYWEQVQRTIETMMKIKDPSIWTAMGFKEVPEMITIEEKKQDETGLFPSWSIKRLPVEPAVLNTLANTVLMSRSLDFTEERYKTKVKNWRKTKEEFKQNGWITPKNKRNVRGGYALTRKGLQVMYEYADATIVKMIEKEMKEGEDGNQE